MGKFQDAGGISRAVGGLAPKAEMGHRQPVVGRIRTRSDSAERKDAPENLTMQ